MKAVPCGRNLYDLPLELLIHVNCCSQERVGEFCQSNLAAALKVKRISRIVLLLCVLDEGNFCLSFWSYHHASARLAQARKDNSFIYIYIILFLFNTSGFKKHFLSVLNTVVQLNIFWWNSAIFFRILLMNTNFRKVEFDWN